jgi:hypothetical protein
MIEQKRNKTGFVEIVIGHLLIKYGDMISIRNHEGLPRPITSYSDQSPNARVV